MDTFYYQLELNKYKKKQFILFSLMKNSLRDITHRKIV